MSRKRVIVKRLGAIQNFGAMDVLCTDKTGTLTMDRVILEKHCDVVREHSDDVLRTAYLNSYFQTGLKNVLDRAILAHGELPIDHTRKVDEIPFDFGRKIMSVVVEMRRPAPADRQGRAGRDHEPLHAVRAERPGAADRAGDRRRSPRGVPGPQHRRLPRAGLGLSRFSAEGGLRQGRRVRPWSCTATWPSSIRPRSRPGCHRGGAEARRADQSAHRRQRPGHAEDLSRGRAGRRPHRAGQRRGADERRSNWPRRRNRRRSSPGFRPPTSGG